MGLGTQSDDIEFSDIQAALGKWIRINRRDILRCHDDRNIAIVNHRRLSQIKLFAGSVWPGNLVAHRRGKLDIARIQQRQAGQL